ncbi:hypothetical protein [Pseudomonas sp. PDM19]|uniref:hypothetical protein n=1 Tax=Pseudomonas sp. PDM19 TaxID=2769272 RepID=UPI00177EBADA|nr:hypothetical protein [Pseudomonas sp. PDM19]MBD9629587.1 hypothetical protein [Pseudomonas sp. PDM19]
MTEWVISYQKDNNTSTLDMNHDGRPSIEQATAFLLGWVRQNLPTGEYGAARDQHGDASSTELLRRYGITLSGIAEK